MPECSSATPAWLVDWMASEGITLWGVADLRGLSAPLAETGTPFPCGISFALPVDRDIMAAVRNGPTHPYAAEYVRLNNRIDRLGVALAAELVRRGFSARPLPSSQRTDWVRIAGEFPQKTVATRAGLGWIGRNCQLVTRSLGPWVRLGSVFTDLALPCGTPVEESSCGGCMRCVQACPSGALKGAAWQAGMPREALLDAAMCDRWKKEHYAEYEDGHICGICSAVCPFGSKALRQVSPERSSDGLLP